MKGFGNLFLWLILGLVGYLFYKNYKEKEQRAEETRQKLFDFFKAKLERIRIANSQFSKYLDQKTGYFTNYQLTLWKSQQATLFTEIKDKPYQAIQLTGEEVKSITTFKDYCNNADKLRSDFNKIFVFEELKNYSKFFDSVEGRKLDTQQRTSVVSDEDNNIVIAGAGSGKTTTIVGKVNYIIDRYKVAPEEILLISFTNKSASTLAERINIKGVDAKTFHKFGKNIITEGDGKQPSIFDEAQFKPLLTRFFTELMRDEKYLQKVMMYFANFLKPADSQFNFENQGDYIQYMKDQNFRTYKLKEIPTNGKTTYKMEVVKSIQECKIANFFLFNGIKYEYELPYEHDTATESFSQYKPDFTINQNNKKVYIEHFGISREGNVPSFFAKEGETPFDAKKRYWEKIEWARDLHKRHDTKLIQTYSYEMDEEILENNLTKHLEEAGITLHPKSALEVWQIISNAAQDEVEGFTTLFGTFITLMKSNNYSINDVISKNKQLKDGFFKKRNELFIEIIKPIYERYERHLAERGEIDFSDMINKASNHISTGKYKRKFSYVIIDEFQDISIGRYQLVKAIKSSNPACKLFCVGDDWQSIYRFAGSDIALFKDFEKFFGFTVKSKIETTYRFHNPLLKLSSDFIGKNPNQTKKELRGFSNERSTNYKISYSYGDSQDDTQALQNIFNELLTSDPKIAQKEIIILGRYRMDIERIKNGNGVFQIDKEKGTVSYCCNTGDNVKHLVAQFLTVHKAKGLEADIVIILNCNSGKFGFPSEMSDDKVLNLLLSEADQFENGEERRLFYVAMTRAKERVYFVADSSFKSKFITELEIESKQSPNKKCPRCKSADVVLRREGTAKNGNGFKFYGCINYLYGCEYTTTEWENKNQTAAKTGN